MRRRAWDILCGLSLLVALLAAGLWARSVWWASDHVELTTNTISVQFVSKEGCVGLLRFSHPVGPQGWLYWSRPAKPDSATRWWPVEEETTSFFVLALPAWMVIATSCGLAGTFIVLGAEPAKPGHCPACGYDLRGTSGGGGGGASGGACPECGAGGAGAG